MIDKSLLLEFLEEDKKYLELVNCIKLGQFDIKDYKKLSKLFQGEKLKDFYCNGWFGRVYDLEDAEILDVLEKDSYIVVSIRTEEGIFNQAFFEEKDWKEVYNYLVLWTTDKEEYE